MPADPVINLISDTITETEVVKVAFKGWNAQGIEDPVTPAEVLLVRFSGQPVRGIFDVTTPSETVNIAFKGWDASAADTATPSELINVFRYKPQPQTVNRGCEMSLSIRM